MGRANIRSKKPTSKPTPAAGADAPSARPSSQPLKKSLRLDRSKSFVTRIEKSSTKTSAKPRRRKATTTSANDKLSTTLSALADALPEDSVNIVDAAGDKIGDVEVGMFKGKGIKSRPGAMKRKEKLVRSECERFGRNLAILETMGGQKVVDEAQKAEAGKVDGGVEVEKPKSRWELLRGFIGQTLEKKEEFVAMDEEKAAKMVM